MRGGKLRLSFPVGQFQINSFSCFCDLAPQVMFPNLFPGLGGCGFPDFGVGNQKLQHALQIIEVTMPEGKARALHYLAVFGNIAGEQANPGSHGVQQGQ